MNAHTLWAFPPNVYRFEGFGAALFGMEVDWRIIPSVMDGTQSLWVIFRGKCRAYPMARRES